MRDGALHLQRKRLLLPAPEARRVVGRAPPVIEEGHTPVVRDVVGGIVDFLGVRRYLRWRRAPAVRAFAESHGLAYAPAGGMDLAREQIGLFMHGIRNGFENVFVGTWNGLPVKAADYWSYTESTNSQGQTSG